MGAVARLVGFGLAVLVGCSDDPEPPSQGVRCGAGTIEVNGECQPEPAGAAGGGDCDGCSGRGGGEADPSGEGGAPVASGGQSTAGVGARASEAGAPPLGSAGEGGMAGQPGQDPTLVTDPLACGSRDVTGATVITEPITSDTTWSGVVHLPQGASIRNEAVVTIEPGTKVIVGLDATIEVGWQGSHPTVRALGTIESPIYFCAETDVSGYWDGLVFRGGVNPDSILRNVLIAEGGGTAAALTLEGEVTLQGVQVRKSAAWGVSAARFGVDSSTLIVAEADEAPVFVTASPGVEIPPGSVLTGNGVDVIELHLTTFAESATFRDVGVPYRQRQDSIVVNNAIDPPTASFEPGVRYQLPRGTTLRVAEGDLVAIGSEAEPVLFSGIPCDEQSDGFICANEPEAEYGQGGRIQVMSQQGGTRLEHVVLNSLGWTEGSSTAFGALYLGGLEVEFPVIDVTVIDAMGYGIGFGDGVFAPESGSISITVRENYSGPRYVLFFEGGDALTTLPESTTLPEYPRIFIDGFFSRSGTIRDIGTYFVEEMDVADGATVEIEAGTLLHCSGTVEVWADSTLRALGSADAPVVFDGPFDGVVVDIGGNLDFDHVVVDNGARGPYDANIAARSPISITNSTISNAQGWGIRKFAADTNDYALTNTFTNNASGNIGSF